MADICDAFISFYRSLPIVKGTCRIFERNDAYSFYEDDAKLVNKEVLKASKLKKMGTGAESLSYVNISKSNLIQALKYLVFVQQYKIEILKNNGTAKSPQWVVNCKASPGNLTAIEDLLFGDCETYVHESRGLMAIKMIFEGPEVILGMAHCDTVLREIQICQVVDKLDLTNFQSVLVQLSPQECLLPVVASNLKTENSARLTLEKILKAHNIAITEIKPGDFSFGDLTQDLKRLLQDTDFNYLILDEPEKRVALHSVAAVIKYLQLLSDEHNFGQFTLSVFRSELYAKLDAQAISGLALFPQNPKDFQEKDFLFGHLNSCFTGPGKRLLVQWIKQPLMDKRKLEERLDIVETFVNDFSLRNETSRYISKFPDLETLSRKIQRRKANLQDLYKIYLMILQLPNLTSTLSKYNGLHADVLKANFIEDLQERISDFENFKSMIESVLDFEALKNKEFVVKAEYDDKLLELRDQISALQDSINETHDDVKQDLDLQSVKLEYAKNIGYSFRVTRKEEKNLRNKKGYTVIDTKTSGVRFQSASLSNLNSKYLSLKTSYENLQKSLVDQIIDVAVSYTHVMKLLSHTIAWLDVALAFTRISVDGAKPYVRPKLKEKGECHIILKQARHPILESKLGNFIPNDVEISKEKHIFYFVTGPNMGGKSTYIKSVALNVLLAQIGCFVPCDEAIISLTDAFLTRIGACDKSSKGISTFMYEMLEIQMIIRSATSSSLLIIDEMGRGTSTYDGFGLSWAISRHIAEVIKSPCLFATHYHELTELSKTVPTIGNLHVEALSMEGDIIFLYRVKPGCSDESFGIHVARLAKFPETVIKKAEKKLKELDETHISLEEIASKFSSVPKGEVIIQAFQKALSVASCDKNMDSKEDKKEMDIDSSHLQNKDIDLNKVSLNISELEALMKVLEELE